MLPNSAPFSIWPLEKQYMAAQFYLTSEKPLFMSEAQKSQLMALHMQAIYGSCKDGMLLPEIQNCTTAEKKKRFKDWKQLGTENKIPAMRRFIDLMTDLFPNWFKNRKIYTDFELDWLTLKKKEENEEKISSFTLLSEKERSPQSTSMSKNFSNKKMASSLSTPMHLSNRKPLYNSPEIASVIHTVKSGNQEISGFKFREEIYKLRQFSPQDKNTVDCTPIILRNLFENLESQVNLKKSKKIITFREHFVGLPQKSANNESLEQCVEHIKDLLIALEENANEAYEGEGNALENAVSQFETDIVESIIRPKLELLSGVIKEIEVIFKNELSSKALLVSEIHKKFVSAIDTLFSYLQALDKSKLELFQQKQNSDKSVKMLEQGFLAIKELNDPSNAKYKLFGITKKSKAQYTQDLQNSKSYLPQEDVDIMIDIEQMLTNNEEKANSLIDQLKLKDSEVSRIRMLLREVQEKAYKDNIDLANQCKKLKESLGLLRGNKNQDLGFEITYKTENDLLKTEIEQLKAEKNQLYYEILQLKSQSHVS